MTDIAPGFVDLNHLFDQRVNTAGWQIIFDAVDQTAALHAAALDQMLSALADSIDPNTPQHKFKLPVFVEMQTLEGEDDSPVPVRGFDEYNIGFPLRDVGLAWGTNRKSRAKLTVRDANAFTVAVMQADSRWQRRQMFTAMLNNTQYTYDDAKHGNITVKPLANSDTDRYHDTEGNVATDDHFYAQAAAIDDTHNPFETLSDELTEHPDNQGETIVYLSTSLKTSVRGLSEFIPFAGNRRIQYGTSSDVATDFPDVLFGDRKLGHLQDSDVWAVEWKALPAGYGLVITTSPSKKPLAYRDEPEAELRGLRTEYNNSDGNHVVERLLRTRGFAVQNRIAAVAIQIGSASYTVPAAYDYAPQL